MYWMVKYLLDGSSIPTMNLARNAAFELFIFCMLAESVVSQIRSVAVSGTYGSCTSGCCGGACTCGSTTNIFTSPDYTSFPPIYTVSGITITSTSPITSFSWIGGTPLTFDGAGTWTCPNNPTTCRLPKLTVPSLTTEDRGTTLSCGLVTSGSCSITICVKLCVDLPRDWSSNSAQFAGDNFLQILPRWPDSADTPTTCGLTSPCFLQNTLTCPGGLINAAYQNGVGTSSPNNFVDAVKQAYSCYVGWVQRSRTSTPVTNHAWWNDVTEAANVGLILGTNITFQLRVPLTVKDSTGKSVVWFTMANNAPLFNIDILAIEDPGLPLNMSLLGQTTYGGQSSGFDCTNAFCRTVDWTPIVGQENFTWQAHFVARRQCCANAECLPDQFSNILSVFLPVSIPMSRFDQLTVNLDESYSVTVGEPLELNLQCDTEQGRPTIQIESMMKNGMMMSDSSDYMGLDVGMFAETAAESNCTLGSPYMQPLQCSTTAKFSLTTSPGDEGSVKQWCFRCRDANAVSPGQLKCITVSTNLCEYQVQQGDTLRSISRRFYQDSNWVRLWNANPLLMDPDLGRNPALSSAPGTELITPGAMLRLGPVYTVRYGDTLRTIAGLFETTIKILLSANPHILAADEPLVVGSDMCILPCTNQQILPEIGA